jgi:hypothetical protein
VVTVENVVLAVPSPDFDGRERLTLAHGDQDAAQAGAGAITDWPEVPVEQLRCAVDGTDDAGDRDQLFASLPKSAFMPSIPAPIPASSCAFTTGLFSGVDSKSMVQTTTAL